MPALYTPARRLPTGRRDGGPLRTPGCTPRSMILACRRHCEITARSAERRPQLASVALESTPPGEASFGEASPDEASDGDDAPARGPMSCRKPGRATTTAPTAATQASPQDVSESRGPVTAATAPDRS